MPKASRKKYKCTQCSYSSKRPHDLKRHLSSLHGEGQSHRESKPERTPIRTCSVQSIITPVPGNAEKEKGQQRALSKRGVTSHIVSSDSDSSESIPDIFINQSSNSPTPIDKPKKEKTRIGPTSTGDSKNIKSNRSSESAVFGSERAINPLMGANNSSVYQLKKKKEPNAEEEVESDVKDAKKCNGSLINSSLNEEMPEDAHPTVESVICTACCNQINPFDRKTFTGHPVLNVVICKECLDLYNSGPWKKDKDGIEEECRWCGLGSSLSLCDFCCRTFCRRCIMCNLGIVELDRTFSKKKWKCFVCEPSPLKELVAKCSALLSGSEEEMELKRRGTNSDDASVNVPDAQDKPEENADVESESEENLHKKAKKVRKSAEIDPTSKDQPLSFDSSSDEESDAESDSRSGLKRKSLNRKSKKGVSREVAENILMDEFEDNEGDGDKDDEKVDSAGSKWSKKWAKAEEDEEWDNSESINEASESDSEEDTDDDFASSESDNVSYEKPKRKRVTRSETESSSEESSVELKKPKKRRARREEPGTSSEADSSQETKSRKRGRGKGKKWSRINDASDSDSEEDTDDDCTSSESDNVSDETPEQKRATRSQTASMTEKSSRPILHIEIATSSEDEEDEDTLKKKKGKKGKAAPQKKGKATKKTRRKKIDTDDDLTSSESDNVSYEKPKQKRVTRSETESSSEELSVELKKPKKRARREEPGTSSKAISSRETKSMKRGGRGKGKKWSRINDASDSDSEEDTDDDCTSSELDNVSDETPEQKRATRSQTASKTEKSSVDGGTKKSRPLLQIEISTSSEDEEDEDTLKKRKDKEGKAAPQKKDIATKKRRRKKIDTNDDFAASESDDVSHEKPKRKRVTRSETASK